MYRKILLSSFIALGMSFSASAKPSINDMQGCQAVLDFVDYKLDQNPQGYSQGEITAVRKGLDIYNQFLQDTVVTPGLLEFNRGDKGKADAMQKQVDAYKAQLVAGFKQKNPQNKIFTDFAVMINNCAKVTVPTGADLEALKTSLETMVSIARKG